MKFYNLPIGDEAPEIVEAVIEISKDSNAKYEYDTIHDVFRLDRCLMSSMSYPANYGFIPSTFADDGDALDILIFNSTPLLTGTCVKCRVLGVLDMTDSGAKDYKVLGVPLFNPNNYTNIYDVDPMFLHVTKHFFEHYKELEDKTVEMGNWLDASKAYEIIKESNEAFHIKYPSVIKEREIYYGNDVNPSINLPD